MNNNPDTSSNTSDSRLTELTIRQLISSITPVQLWAVLGAIFILLAGAFGFGYKVQEWQSQAEKSELRIDLKTLETQHQRLRAKENVLRLYFQYASADSDIRYIQDEIPKLWEGLDSMLGLERQESPGQLAMESESLESLSIDKLLKVYSKVHSNYVSLVGKRGFQDISAMGIINSLQLYEESIKQLEKLEKSRLQTEKGLKELLDYHVKKDIDRVGYELILGNASKELTGWGTIKFAYDGMELRIPNEFLPAMAR